MAYEQIHMNRYNKDEKKKVFAFTAGTPKSEKRLMNLKVKKLL